MFWMTYCYVKVSKFVLIIIIFLNSTKQDVVLASSGYQELFDGFLSWCTFALEAIFPHSRQIVERTQINRVFKDFERKTKTKYFLSQCCRDQNEHFNLECYSNESGDLSACDHMSLGVNSGLASCTRLSERV